MALQLNKYYYLLDSWKNPCQSSLKGARIRYRAAGGLFLVLWMFVFEAAAVTSTSAEKQNTKGTLITFDISQQTMHTALIEFAEQADLTLVFPDNVVRNRYSNVLIGRYTLQEGIDILLSGTGLYASFSNEIMLTIATVKPQPAMKEKTIKMPKKTGLIVALANLLWGAGNVSAESSDAEREESAIEEVIVTALKRSQSLQDVPASISALNAEDLSDKGISDMSDIQFVVPSLHFGGFLGSQNISIRGIGEFNGQPGVAVSLDGIYQPRATTAQLSQLDLERVEVLRGPQGTLYGRNSNGGVVNFISGAPTQEREGYVKVSYAQFDEKKIEGVYSGALTDDTSIRIAANYTDIGDGWIENQVASGNDLMQGNFSNFRIKLHSEATDNLSFDVMYARSKIEGPMDHYAWLSDNRDLAIGAGVPQLATANITLEPRKQFADFDADSSRDYEVFSVTADWELPFANLRSITAYQTYENDKSDDRDSTDQSLYIALNTASTDSFSQELNLTGSNDSIDWVVGVFYANDEREDASVFKFDQPVLGFPAPAVLDYQRPTYDTTSKAVFVDATWNVSERVRLSAGARRTEDELEDEHSIEFFLKLPALTSIGKVCDSKIDVDWGATTYRAVGEYDTSDTGNLYVSYSEGYKAGGVVSSECTPAYDPEEVAAYEIGYKKAFNDGQSSLSAAVFYYDYTDFQVAQIIGLASATINAGDAEVTGLELEAATQLTDKWKLNFAVTLLDSEYGKFLNTDGLQPALGAQQLEGNRLNNSPETSFNFGATYHTQLAFGGLLTLRLDAAYRSQTFFREFNARDDSQSAYTIVNLNAIWESDDELWRGRLFAKNLTNEDYVTGLVGSSSNGGRLGNWGPPRQVGIELTRFIGAGY